MSISSTDNRDAQAAFLSVKNRLEDVINSREELAKALQNSGRSPTTRTLANYWTQKHQKAGMNFEEFQDTLRAVPMQTEEDLLRAFRKINTNNDGSLSYDEFRLILQKKGEKLGDNEVREIFDIADTNHDGKLDFDEFAKMVMKTAEETRMKTLRRLKRRDIKESQKTKESEKHPQTPLLVTKPSLMSVKAKHKSPSGLENWTTVTSKGCCFFDDCDDRKTPIAHQYELLLTEDDDVYLTVEILPSDPSASTANNDILIVVLNEDNNNAVAISDYLDPLGHSCLQSHLSAGRYRIIPLSTNCVFQPRSKLKKISSRVPLVDKVADGSCKINKQFRLALMSIFDLFDLDSNGFLSRDEFNLYNLRTGDDEVTDEEWVVVRGNFENKDDQLTMKGFIQLHQLEADDAVGDTEDMWLSLKSVGFSEQLILDEAYPFLLSVHAANTKPKLTPLKFFCLFDEALEKQLSHYYLNRADSYHSNDSCCISLFQTDFMAVFVGSGHQSGTIAATSIKGGKNIRTGYRPTQSALAIGERVLHYVMPLKAEDEWSCKCVLTSSD